MFLKISKILRILTVLINGYTHFLFIDIFIEAHPNEARDMLKYMSTIQVGVRRGASGLKEYDLQYRLRKGAGPTSS